MESRDAHEEERSMRRREIGPVGTALRVVVAFLLLYIAGADDGSWQVNWYEPIIGFVVLPGVMIGAGLVARRVSDGPVHFMGWAGHLANLAIIVVLIANPYTASGATLFYGTTMLVAAWRGQRGCEGTVISNLVLRRDDQIGCPLFAPFDELEDWLSRPDRKHGRHSVHHASSEEH
jgi:hypothetical protein